MSDQITVVATITARTEYLREVENALKVVERDVQNEQGCKLYQLYINKGADNQFVMIEHWQSEAMLEQHEKGQPFQALIRAIEDKANITVVTLSKV